MTERFLHEFFKWRFQQQEQDPTNLYMANLPPHFKENDVDQLLAKFGQVVSTRILRDTFGQSKGVGFARMESREKCEQIIQVCTANNIPRRLQHLTCDSNLWEASKFNWILVKVTPTQNNTSSDLTKVYLEVKSSFSRTRCSTAARSRAPRSRCWWSSPMGGARRSSTRMITMGAECGGTITTRLHK